MIRRLVSTAVALLAILTVTAPGVLAPIPAAADPRADARSSDWRHDRDRRHDRHDRHDRRFLFVPRSYYVPYTYVAPAPTWVPTIATWVAPSPNTPGYIRYSSRTAAPTPASAAAPSVPA